MSLSRIEVRQKQRLTSWMITCIVLVVLAFMGWIGASLWAYFNRPASGAYGQFDAAETLGITALDDFRRDVMNNLASKGEYLYDNRWLIIILLTIAAVGFAAMWITLRRPSDDKFNLG